MRVFLFLILLASSFTFGQSDEKLNQQLRSQLKQAKTELDSTRKVIYELKRNLSDSWYKVENNEFKIITEHGKIERLLHDNVGYLYEALTKLNDKPEKTVNIQQIKETRIPLMEAESLYRSYSYLSGKKLKIFAENVGDTLKLGKYPVNIENELLPKVLNQYAAANGKNKEHIEKLTQYQVDMETFKVKAGEIYQKSSTAYDRLWNAYASMKDRFSKLNTDYQAKGAKAFPPVYKEVFDWAAEYKYPKEIDPVHIKL